VKWKATYAVLVLGLSAGIPLSQHHDPEPLSLVVNVPASRLDVWRAGRSIRSYGVAVGAPAFPTPIGEFTITEITWNPWWLPPQSKWAEDRKPEPPGENNPMGVVKLRFADLYYVHGTADVRSVGHAASHGCVRLSNSDAVELARTVQEAVGPHFTAEQIDSILGPRRRTRAVTLSAPIALRIVYERIEATDSVLLLHPDPYRRGTPTLAQAMTLLRPVLASDVEVDSSRLASLLALPVARTVVIPVHTITRRTDAPPQRKP